MFTAIADKINSLNAEIVSIEQTIARLEAEAKEEAEEAKTR